ncbi:Uncharacterised protein [Wolbachia endosymbiont wPip_Mol of Culex molestus]|nr:Hypothetical protein WP0842 [Wolbachia endosymbiont of Culex quinquefasciatus Pel]CQD09514.1 Uncharacterised protein [Wolbachia endosymbiont wPip_Mol of Culex molestus]
MKSLYEGGMKTLLDKSLHFPYYGNKSIYPCFWAQRQNSVKKLRYLLAGYKKL